MAGTQTTQRLDEIKALLIADQEEAKSWRDGMLEQFKALNGTVRIHTTELAVLQEKGAHRDAQVSELAVRVRDACRELQELQISQAKAAAIGAVIGALVAALAPLLTALRAWIR